MPDPDFKAQHLLAREEIPSGRFLRVERVRLQNERTDGSLSPEYFCEFLSRIHQGADAVAVCLWRRSAVHGVEVLLRSGLRPTLRFGRPAAVLTVPDRQPYVFLTEVVAGMLEHEDQGEGGIARRASLEAWEEAGLRVSADAVQVLGRVFMSPGCSPEACYLAVAEVAADAVAAPPAGDGSPMEEGGFQQWVALHQALAQCDRGDIEDGKTEILLRRLAARLDATSPSATRR